MGWKNLPCRHEHYVRPTFHVGYNVHVLREQTRDVNVRTTHKDLFLIREHNIVLNDTTDFNSKKKLISSTK